MAGALVLFLDGVGLGPADPARNPFSIARMPTIVNLLEGHRLVEGVAPFTGEHATLLALDPRLGVEGLPQSATGQAAILTGRNVPALIGEHYGPKPNRNVAEIVREDNLFCQVTEQGGSCALLNAYPPRYFEAIESGRRIYSTIPMAFTAASLPLMNEEDLRAGRAMAADFTGAGWLAQPGFPPAPLYTQEEAGALLARLALQHDLTWFDFWLSDYIGHRGTLKQAVELLENFDAVLGSLVASWGARRGLIVMTSDHGNLEDLSHRKHTLNPVPALLIGPEDLRRRFASDLSDLTTIASAVVDLISD